jgi:hypothetical protein
LKTHGQSLEARENLEKEIDVLTYLYGLALHTESFSTEDGRLWLAMDALLPADPVSPTDIRRLTGMYMEKLATYPERLRVRSEDNFSRLLLESEQAFVTLCARGQIGPDLRRAIPHYFDILVRMKSQMHFCLCHGDLGPCNLMFDGTSIFAVDWEDAFWGIEGYDYLYWLTFFGNRPHLNSNIFGYTPWGKDVDIAILLMVLLIKCRLSFHKGTYVNDKLTFDQRLMEILDLA